MTVSGKTVTLTLAKAADASNSVTLDHADTDGISVAANKLTLPGGATAMGTVSGGGEAAQHAIELRGALHW